MKGLFIYPTSKETVKKDHNNYIPMLRSHLGGPFKVVNGVTEIGLLDALKKFRRTDVFYFNWIEDVATKRYGALQVGLLFVLLRLCKWSGKKVIWFVHNNVSHTRKALKAKKAVVRLMRKHADLIFSHSAEIKIDVPAQKLRVFHHPLEDFKSIEKVTSPAYDLLIWGSVAPYKGVGEFIEYLSSSRSLADYKILIAGRFSSTDYYDRIAKQKTDNVTILNQYISEEQLAEFFATSRYTLFTYTSDSVLSSAALCKSLSYGQQVIGPNVGSFKELGALGLVQTYHHFRELEQVLATQKGRQQDVDQATALHQYVRQTSWAGFTEFVVQQVDQLYRSGAKKTFPSSAPFLPQAREVTDIR